MNTALRWSSPIADVGDIDRERAARRLRLKQRTHSLRRLDGERPAVGERDRGGQAVAAIIENRDDCIVRLVGLPLADCRIDAREGAGRPVLLHRVTCRRRRKCARADEPLSSVIRSAAEAGAESVPVADVDRIDGAEPVANGQPAGLHVDRDDLSSGLRCRPRIEPHAHDLRDERVRRRVGVRWIDTGPVEPDIKARVGGDCRIRGAETERPVQAGEIGRGRQRIARRIVAKILVEQDAAYGCRHIVFGGDAVEFPAQTSEQGGWVAERTEMVAPRYHRRPRRRVDEGIALQPPQEKADIADVVPSFRLGRLAHVDRVHGLVKRAVDAFHDVERAEIGPRALKPQVLEKLRPAEQLEELDHVRRPAGHVAGELFEHHRRCLAPAIMDGLCHVGAGADRHRRAQIFSGQIGKQRISQSPPRCCGSGRIRDCC